MRHNFIIRHAFIIVLIWIVIAALSAPLASRIEEVTNYSAEKLLPNGTDSVKAAQLLSEITSGGNATGGGVSGLAGAMTFDIILVTGINASDKRLVYWDIDLNSSLKQYVKDYSSPYHTVYIILEDINETLINSSRLLYNMSKTLVQQLEPLYDNRDYIIEYINTSHEILVILKAFGDNASSNITWYEEEARWITGNISLLKEMYINLSRAYNESIKGLESVHGLGVLLYNMLLIGDQYYSEVAGQLEPMYENLTMINETVEMLNRMYYNVSISYTDLLFDVSRIHYYLLTNTTAYQSGLNMSMIYRVVNYTNLSGYPVLPRLVNETYQLITSRFDPYNVSDLDLFRASSLLLAEEYTSLPLMYRQMYTYYLTTYNETMYNVLESMFYSTNVSSMLSLLGTGIVTGQLTLHEYLVNAWNTSLPISADVFAENTAPIVVQYMGLPSNATPAITALFRDAVLPGYPPDPVIYEDVVVNDTVYLFSTVSGQEPLNATYVLVRDLYEYGPVLKAAMDSLHTFLGEVFPAPPEIVDYAYTDITTYDYNGTGIFTANQTLLNITVASTLSNITGLPPSITLRIFLNESSIPVIVRDMMKSEIINMTGNPGFGVIADVVYNYSGRPCLDGFLKILESTGSSMFKGFLPEGFNASMARQLIIEAGVDAWYGRLQPVFFEKLLLIGDLAGKLSVIYQSINMPGASGNFTASSIMPVMYNLSIINALINHSYTTNPEYYVVESYVELMSMFIGNINSAMPFELSTDDLKAIAYRLLSINGNASLDRLVDAFIDYTINTMMNKSNLPIPVNITINTSMFKPLLHDIIVEGVKPIDALINHLEDLLPSNITGNIDIDELKSLLRKALDEDSYEPVYRVIYRGAFDEIFSNVTSSFKGLMISPNNNAFIIVISPKDEPGKYDNALKAKDVVMNTLKEYGYRPEYVGVTGDDVLSHEAREANSRDIENVNRISIIAPIIIALVLIGGFIAAGLPFLGIGLSVLLSTAILYILGYFGVVNVTSWARMLMITTSFGLGMDYSSYIVLRYKEKIAEFKDSAAAAHDALIHSIPAIAAASSTDIIGFAVMMLAWDFPLLSSIGQMVPIAILTVLAASLTFTPAVLAKWGDRRWFWWPHRVEAGRARWKGFTITRGRALALITLSLVLGGIGAYGLLTFQGSHDYSVFMPEGTEGYKAYMKLQKVFPAGQLMPIYVVGRISSGSVWDSRVMDEIKSMASAISDLQGVVEVYGPHNPGDKPKTVYVGSDNKTFYLEVIIKPSPMSNEGIELTKEIRSIVYHYRGGVFSELYVGGLAASSLEMEELLNRDFWQKIFPVGIVLMWLAMTISFMSIWAGVISLSTIVIGYMIGVTLASKIPGMYGQPALWFLPLMTFPAVLGVGMDYNSFYMNRQREELGKRINDRFGGYVSATTAIRAVSHLVIGLGLIVTSTYSALVIGSSWGVRELGLALAGGVFTTTLLAALLFTPPILALMGRRAWWPYSKRWRKK